MARPRLSDDDDGQNTRNRILDAAEDLFSRASYDGVSMRKVTQQANADLGLISYYFGTKESLYKEVLTRRSETLNAERLRRLDEIHKQAGSSGPSVKAILKAYIMPLLDRLPTTSDGGWRNYSRLVCQNSQDAFHVEMLSRIMDPTASHFISALRVALPGMPLKDIYWGFNFTHAAMTASFAENGRIDRLSHGLCRASDLEDACTRLVEFAAGGFQELILGEYVPPAEPLTAKRRRAARTD